MFWKTTARKALIELLEDVPVAPVDFLIEFEHKIVPAAPLYGDERTEEDYIQDCKEAGIIPYSIATVDVYDHGTEHLLWVESALEGETPDEDEGHDAHIDRIDRHRNDQILQDMLAGRQAHHLRVRSQGTGRSDYNGWRHAHFVATQQAGYRPVTAHLDFLGIQHEQTFSISTVYEVTDGAYGLSMTETRLAGNKIDALEQLPHWFESLRRKYADQ